MSSRILESSHPQSFAIQILLTVADYSSTGLLSKSVSMYYNVSKNFTKMIRTVSLDFQTTAGIRSRNRNSLQAFTSSFVISFGTMNFSGYVLMCLKKKELKYNVKINTDNEIHTQSPHCRRRFESSPDHSRDASIPLCRDFLALLVRRATVFHRWMPKTNTISAEHELINIQQILDDN